MRIASHLGAYSAADNAMAESRVDRLPSAIGHGLSLGNLTLLFLAQPTPESMFDERLSLKQKSRRSHKLF